MANGDTEVVVIGGGAAGIAAARRLAKAAIKYLLIEARPRLGGRAYTVSDANGHALDLGCGWLHSADRNPWVAIAQAQGRTIDRSSPPWSKPALTAGFSAADQADFAKAQHDFFERVSAAAAKEPDVAAAELLEPHGRWNHLIGAVATYISGAELARLSSRDFDNYAGNNVNWRVAEGYGTAIAAHGDGLAVMLDCPVLQIDHRGRRLKIETPKGTVTADRAIITLPSAVIADKEFLFAPALPEKTESARGLPLGLADKLFLALEDAEEFGSDTRAFGHIDSAATATYQFRPLGRPLIEVYFGGALPAELEMQGDRAFFDFAVSELTGLFGANFAQRVKQLPMHCWGTDPFARGSYSFALPGKADCRVRLAAPVDDRLFFAGEACSKNDFSTAHGGYLTGVAAADQAIAARSRKRVG
jgi:monoamine oxidase